MQFYFLPEYSSLAHNTYIKYYTLQMIFEEIKYHLAFSEIGINLKYVYFSFLEGGREHEISMFNAKVMLK